MSKTLIVQYTPREDSNTKKILDTAVASVKGEMEVLDLAKETPHIFTYESVAPFLGRSFAGIEPTDEQKQLLTQVDKFSKQLLDADNVILAFPFWNYGPPAAIKAWVDCVVEIGRTAKFKEGGGFEGLIPGKKVLTIISAGGDYSEGSPMHAYDYAQPWVTQVFNFMGVTDIKFVWGKKMNQDPEGAPAEVERAGKEAAEIVASWIK